MTTTMETNSRVPIVAGNWKLNPSTIQEASALLKLLASNFVHHRNEEGEGIPEVIVFPPSPFLERAVTLLEGTGIKVGAQNVGLESKGAFTGEISPSMVRSMGCDYVMVGHSERRTLHDETNEIVGETMGSGIYHTERKKCLIMTDKNKCPGPSFLNQSHRS